MCVCVCVCICVYVRGYVCVCMCVCMCGVGNVCTYIYIYISIIYIYINIYIYDSIVTGLNRAERATIPRIPHSALRPFWNDELDDLKDKCIFWHNLWKSAGCPASGTLQQIKASAKLNYKRAIKHACFVFENQHNDVIFYHFLNKRMPEFWKCWASKFHRNLGKEVYVNG